MIAMEAPLGQGKPPRMRRRWALLGLSLPLVAGAAIGQDCTPGRADARFVFNADGTATDGTTGLTWKRCSEGQAWDGSTCTGDAALHDWQEAMALGQGSGEDGWRLPSLDELASIIDRGCSNPSVDPGVFPATPSAVFWSTTTDANADYAWFVHLRDGHASKGHKYRGGYVRRVRGSS